MTFNIDNILFEDNHIIIINKPSGIPSQKDKTNDLSCIELIKDYLKTKYQKKGNVFVGLPHRLDRPTSGCLILTKTSKALKRLNEMLKTHQIKKTYLAVVKNRPPKDSDNVIHYLIKDRHKNLVKAYNYPTENSLYAELNYEIISKTKNFYLLRINLLTGRPHQIRAQLSAINCPVVGDNKYGYPRANIDRSIHLHSYNIQFIHPVTLEKVDITAPLPKDNIWKLFFVK